MLQYQWNNNNFDLSNDTSNFILNQSNNIQQQQQNNNNIQNNTLSQNNNIHNSAFNNNNNIINNNNNQEVNGGVSQILDYDIKLMSDFIIKSSLIAFNVSSYQYYYDTTDFLNKIKSVLNATRLPKVTIFQSLDYLFKYIEISNVGTLNLTLDMIYDHLMISFILANKFNDDKTFTNKSWSQATSIPLLQLNTWERNWLKCLNYNLFKDKFIAYDDFVFSYEIFIQEQLSIPPSSPISSIPSPIIKDTDFTNRQGGFNYDYYIFGQNNNASILPPPQPIHPNIMITPLPIPQQQFIQTSYDPNYYYPQPTNRWNNSDLMNFHVSSINNINYNTVY